MVIHRVLLVVAILPLLLAGCQTKPPAHGPQTMSAPLPGERGRVHVANGTVVTDEGTLLRGASMMIMKQPGYANDPSYWQAVHALGLNAVRLDVKTVQIGKTVEEQLPYLDRAIDLASQNGMYIMFKTSVKPGGYDLESLMDFWRVAAPRYRNRTNVLYELTNEPVSGSPVWGAAHQWTDQVIGDLTQVYNLMRSSGAADAHRAVLDAQPLPRLRGVQKGHRQDVGGRLDQGIRRLPPLRRHRKVRRSQHRVPAAELSAGHDRNQLLDGGRPFTRQYAHHLASLREARHQLVLARWQGQLRASQERNPAGPARPGLQLARGAITAGGG